VEGNNAVEILTVSWHRCRTFVTRETEEQYRRT
jgi:hypothetical protein